MSVVLITGSCGLVGSESVKFFAAKGFDIVGIDNNSRSKFFGKDGNINWIRRNLIKSHKKKKKVTKNQLFSLLFFGGKIFYFQ